MNRCAPDDLLALEELDEGRRHAVSGFGTRLGDLLQQGCAFPAGGAVVGQAAVADLGPKRGLPQGLVVDNHRECVAGIHDFRQIAVIGIGGVGGDDFRGIGVPPRRELDDVGVGLVEGKILRTNPDGAKKVFVVAAFEVRTATEDGEAEFRAGGGLPHAVVTVEVVVEGVEGAVPQAAGIGLYAHELPMGMGPGAHLRDVVETAVIVAARIEGVEELIDVLERDLARDIHVDAEANLDGWKTLADDGCDERRRCGEVVGEESGGVHFVQHRRHVVGERFGEGDVAVAVRVEDGVELDTVLAGPCQVRDNPCTALGRPVVHWTARRHAGPCEEDLLDAVEVLTADVDEGLVVKPSNRQCPFCICICFRHESAPYKELNEHNGYLVHSNLRLPIQIDQGVVTAHAAVAQFVPDVCIPLSKGYRISQHKQLFKR